MEKQTEMNLQEAAFERHLAGMVKKLPFAAECDLSRHPPPLQLDSAGQRNMGMFQGGLTMANINTLMSSNALKQQQDQDVELVGETAGDVINIDVSSRSPTPNRYKRRKSRSRSRDRRGRRRSKSRSRTRSPRSR